MRNLKSLKVVAAVLIAFAMLAAPALAAGQDLTVGKFIIEIANVKELNVTDAVTARNALANIGIDIGNVNLDKILTQGDVVVIANAAGLPMVTSTPETAFSEEQVATFIATFAPDLESDSDISTRSKRPDFDPKEKGNGKHKGHSKRSPCEPI